MKIREIIFEAKTPEAPKPRNFVAKNAKTGGAGAHKDKKKAAKQGDVKHKGKVMAEGLPQTLRKVVPGYAKREIDKKMDDQKFGRTDVDKDANYYRYKKIQDKLKGQGVAEGSAPTVATLDAVFNEHDFDRLEHIWPALEAGDKEEALRQINHYLNRGKNRAWWGDLQALDIKIDTSDVENSIVKWSKPVQQDMEEAGFVDVTGWSPSRVQAMGRADDDGIGSYTSRNKPNLIAWVFYNVEPGQEDQAATLNIRKLKSGKWAMPVYDKSGATYRFQRNKADQVFGPGKRWDIKKEQSNVAETATGMSADNFAVGAIYPNKKGKTPKNKDGTAKNALDMKANLLTGGSIKR